MRFIERGWNSYRKLLPADAPPIQIKETRQAFYAGAAINLGCRVVRTEDETGEHVVLSVPRPPKADEAAIDIAAFRRECARLHSLPRASARNELDNCADCGKHATHTDYRNGRAIGLCSDCR